MSVPSTSHLVTIRDLVYRRGTRLIYNGVNIEIPQGKITAIMGPSGVGKTTLLRLIGGQLRPNAGSIQFAGEEIADLDLAGLYRLRRSMGMLFQSGALFTDLSVFENVAFPLRQHTKLPEPVLRNLVLMKLHAVGLRGAAALMPSELSGGMGRRVALARAIALDPLMIMYDEPFAGQDPIAMGMIAKLIRTLNEALAITSIIVSHDVAEVCAIADKAYVIVNGKVVAHGAPAELQKDSSPLVAQFMQGLADGPVPFHYPAPDYHQTLLGKLT